MDKERAIEYVQKRLKEYGSNIYEYQGVRFIAIRNEFGKSDMVITFDEKNMTMEFATQAARFAYGGEEDIAVHAEKYLKGELCAVEFFFEDQALFGGSRGTSGMNFSTTKEVSDWYADNNEEISANIDKFLKEREIIVLCSIWTATPDRKAKSNVSGKMEDCN